MVLPLAQSSLDSLVDDHLALQTQISYANHHAFLLDNGLNDCRQVLDLGTGTGLFVSRLAADHPEVHFTGVDKRKPCIEKCRARETANLSFELLDAFSPNSKFNFAAIDGFLLRYFLLHVDHATKLLRGLKDRAEPNSRFWIIDLDVSQFQCVPHHPLFDELTAFIQEFCLRTSVESRGGERAAEILRGLGFQKIVVNAHPFTFTHTPRAELIRYLRQEVLCYAALCGNGVSAETDRLIQFIEQDLAQGHFEISYGMILISATT